MLLFFTLYLIHLFNLDEEYRENNWHNDDTYIEEKLEEKAISDKVSLKTENKPNRLLEVSDEWETNDSNYDNIETISDTKSKDIPLVIPTDVIDHIPFHKVDDSDTKGKGKATINPDIDEEMKVYYDKQAQLEISELIKNKISITEMDFNAISNLKSYYENSAIINTKMYEIENININKIKDLINSISESKLDISSDTPIDNKDLWKNILKREQGSISIDSDTSSTFEKIVDEIKSGLSVSIYSPSENPIFSPKSINTEESSTDIDKEPVIMETSKKQVIIVTKKLEEGEGPTPLPSWTNIPYGDTDYQTKVNREKQLIISKAFDDQPW